MSITSSLDMGAVSTPLIAGMKVCLIKMTVGKDFLTIVATNLRAISRSNTSRHKIS